MVVAEEIDAVVSRSEQAIRFEKGWITRDSLVQHFSRLQQTRFRIAAGKKIFGSRVEFERGDVICGSLLNRSFFARGKAGLQLAGNRSRDLSLNREYISKVAVISLPPEPPVGRHID